MNLPSLNELEITRKILKMLLEARVTPEYVRTEDQLYMDRWFNWHGLKFPPKLSTLCSTTSTKGEGHL